MIKISCQAQWLFTAKQYHTEMYSSLLNEQERGKNNRIFCEKSSLCGRWLSEPAGLPIWKRVLVGRAPNMVPCIFSAIFRAATAADRYNQGSVWCCCWQQQLNWAWEKRQMLKARYRYWKKTWKASDSDPHKWSWIRIQGSMIKDNKNLRLKFLCVFCFLLDTCRCSSPGGIYFFLGLGFPHYTRNLPSLQ